MSKNYVVYKQAVKQANRSSYPPTFPPGVPGDWRSYVARLAAVFEWAEAQADGATLLEAERRTWRQFVFPAAEYDASATAEDLAHAHAVLGD